MNLKDLNIIISSPVWSLNGVNIFSVNLARELQRCGYKAQLLVTNPNQADPKPMTLPTDIPVHHLDIPDQAPWKDRWAAMVHYLERNAPCIYLPNYDFDHSCVAPRLSKRVISIGIAHSDDPQHYEHVNRLGPCWNQIVAVSSTIAGEIERSNPQFATRLRTIAYGVNIPEKPPERSFETGSKLKILYAGVFRHSQKRIFDLPKIAQRLRELEVPFEFTIAGGGPDKEEFLAACQPLINAGLMKFIGIVPNDQMGDLLLSNDAFIMTSAFEGLPNALLEAMGQGCIPVVTDIKSGIPEVVSHEENGYLLPVGDIDAFANCLQNLQQNADLQADLSSAAYKKVDAGGYRIRNMAERYCAVFEQAINDLESGQYRRPKHSIQPPANLSPLWKHYVPEAIKLPSRRIRGLAKQLIPS